MPSSQMVLRLLVFINWSQISVYTTGDFWQHHLGHNVMSFGSVAKLSVVVQSNMNVPKATPLYIYIGIGFWKQLVGKDPTRLISKCVVRIYYDIFSVKHK